MIATRTVFAWDAADDVEMPPISATPTAIPYCGERGGVPASQSRSPHLVPSVSLPVSSFSSSWLPQLNPFGCP
jgi:hypothetical protein